MISTRFLTERWSRRSPGADGSPAPETFLAEISRLLADSLDYERTLSTVAALALPHLGAWCVVDVVEGGGRMRRLAIVHPDPDKQELARRLRDGWPPRRSDPLGMPAVMVSREPEVIEEASDDFLRRAARTDENLEILRKLGIGSVIVVPMQARGDVLGAMTFIAPSEQRRRYTERDVELAQDLAARCAIAIDNARLYRDALEARKAAEAANHTKSEFLAMTSHEIRTPINAILGYAQLLEMEVDGPLTEEQRRKVERIRTSSDHLLGLVEQILDMSRLEIGRLTVRNEACTIEDLVSSATSIAQPRIAERSQTLEVDLPQGGDRVMADPIRARQILVNLLVNAAKFTEPGGHVAIRADEREGPGPRGQEGAWTRIHVEDTGDGIPEEWLESIFEPFVQVEPTLTRNVGGAGIGLAISRQLARKMGGDLTVESRPGEGSRFTLWLRRDEPPIEADTDVELTSARDPDLVTFAEIVLRRSVQIVEAYVGRLRRDRLVPEYESDFDLRDTAFTLVASLAGLLAMWGEVGTAESSPALRDGRSIQRLVAELHGAQRRRLGWSEEMVARDFDHLKTAIIDNVRTAAPGDTGTRPVFDLLDRMLEQAKRSALQGWHSSAGLV